MENKVFYLPRFFPAFIILLLFVSCGSSPTDVDNGDEDDTKIEYPAEQWVPDSDIWVGAYLASYHHYAPPGGNWGYVPSEEIDWSAFTHLFYFAIRPQPDGSFPPIEAYQNLSPDRLNSIVEAAHAHETPVLISVGAWGTYEGFSSAIQPENRAKFVENIVALVTDWKFDGIDLDMEPIEDSDVENFTALVEELYAEFDSIRTELGYRPLLTAATNWQAEMFASLSDKLDQINLMTYDYSGAWDGWVSWHNSALFSGGSTFPGASRELPSAHGEVKIFLEAGVPKEKLGIGIAFEGYVWNGYVSSPRQKWENTPTVSTNVPYHEIYTVYYDDDKYRWDKDAHAAYLNINNSNPSKNKFISFDDEQSIKSKIEYIRENGLGGAIIWELSGAHFENNNDGVKDPLLQSVKRELWNE